MQLPVLASAGITYLQTLRMYACKQQVWYGWQDYGVKEACFGCAELWALPYRCLGVALQHGWVHLKSVCRVACPERICCAHCWLFDQSICLRCIAPWTFHCVFSMQEAIGSCTALQSACCNQLASNPCEWCWFWAVLVYQGDIMPDQVVSVLELLVYLE